MSRRKRLAIASLLTISMTALVSGFGPLSIAAWANHSGSAAGQVGGFEIDGNFVADANPGTFDWDTVGAQTNVNGPTRVNDLSNSQSDDAFKGGSKEQTPDTWEFVAQKPPGKADVTRVYYASQIVSSTAYLWLGFERLDVSGDGDVHVNFELNRSTDTVVNSKGATIPKRTDGDLLVVYDYSGGSGPVNVEVRTWSGTALAGSWGAPVSLPAGSAIGDINDGSVARAAGSPFNGGTVDDRRFGEVGLNLTAIFGEGSVPSCPGFASFWAKTRSSGESFNSDLKDTITPVSIDLSTCPDLHVTKSASAATVNAGDGYYYTITATNDGVAPATNVMVTDDLDDDLVVSTVQYDNNPGDGSGWSTCPGAVGAGNVITCNVGTLAASDGNTTGSEPDTAVVKITVRAPKEACPSVLNKAHVSSTDEPENLRGDNDSAQVTVTVLCGNVHVAKTADDSSVSAGDTIGYWVTVTNDGNGRADDVTLTDALPNNAGLSWSVNAWKIDGASQALPAPCSISTGTLTCTFASIASGGTRAVHVTSSTTAATCGTVSNSASVETSNDGRDSAGPVSISVLCPDVHVLKTGNGTISAGDTATFTITVSNDGQGIARDVTLTDSLPAGIDWSEDSASCSISSGTLTCNFGDLGPGASKVVHVSGKTTAEDCGDLVNTAHVSATNESQADQADNSSTGTIHVLCANVAIDKVADDDSVSAGEVIGYTITVRNTGQGRADGVTLTDTLPDNAGLSWTIDGGTGQGACGIASGVLTCDFGSIDSGDSFTVHITSPTTQATCGEVSNSATVTSSNDGTVSVEDVIIDVLCPDTTIVKEADTGSVNAGSVVGFTVTVSNAGPGQAFGVMVNDPLPGDLAWIIDGGTGAAQCEIDAGTLKCDYGTMAPEASKTVHISALTTPTDCGLLDNTAHLSVSNDNPGQSSDSIQVACPKIAIVKSGPAQAHVGDSVTYTMVVTNAGTVALANVAVSDPMCNSGPTFAGGDTNDNGLLDLEEVWTYTCTHVITELDGDPVPNTATAAGDSVIVDALRHVVAESSWEVDIVHPAIQIVKTADPISGSPGIPVTYTYVVTNTGDTELVDIAVTDDKLGAICTIPTLGVGESFTCTKTAPIGGSVVNVGTATGTDTVTPRRTVTDSDDATVTIVLGVVILPRTGSGGVGGPLEAGVILLIVGGLLVWLPRRRLPTRG